MKLSHAIALLAVLLLKTTSLNAQFFREDGYDYYFGPEHRVVVRQPVACTEDYQDLWNGDYVRLNGNYVYIYRGGYRFAYGEKAWLMHNGLYIVKFNETEYLLNSNGQRSGVYGSVVDLLWNGVCRALRGDYWYLYDTNGYRLGSIYSDEKIYLFWNGTYCYHQGSYYHVADSDGYAISNTYSDEEPTLLDSGNYRVWRSGNSYIIDPTGRRVY